MVSPVRANVEWADDGETLIFLDLKTPEVLSACERLERLQGAHYPRVGFDLSRVQSTFSPQALQLVVLALDLHYRGIEVTLTLPEDPRLALLFQNTDWAHLMDPRQFPESKFSGNHLPATQYGSHGEQSDAVTNAFDRLAGQLRMPKDMQYALEWALNEATDNVLTHSETSTGGIVQVTHLRDRVHLVVADSGIGIAESMRTGFPDLVDDVVAVREALKPGVTSGKGQGNGLAGIMSIAKSGDGEVSVLSSACYGHVEYEDGKQGGNEAWKPTYGGVKFPGTVVTLALPTSTQVDIRKALSFQNPSSGWEPAHDPFDISHAVTMEDGVFKICVGNESVGYRSREAGRILRTKAQNILCGEDCKLLQIDFDEIPVIASSFADEFIGKLILENGIIEFMGRVKLTGMNDVVKTVLDGAASQRMRTDGGQP